jgi:hypothetical protein
MKDAGKVVNAWVFPYPGGVYGTDYLQRATVTYFGLGCNRTKDAVYPTSETDVDGNPYERGEPLHPHLSQGPVRGSGPIRDIQLPFTLILRLGAFVLSRFRFLAVAPYRPKR